MITKDASRWFLALIPDSEPLNALSHLIKLLPEKNSARNIPQNQLHMTLRFFGQLTEGTATELVALLDTIEIKPFKLQLDQFGYWKRSQVLFAKPSIVPPELTELIEKIDYLCKLHDVHFDDRVFKPHITLQRKQRRKPITISFDSIFWTVQHMSLMQSVSVANGVEYYEIKRWRFAHQAVPKT